MCHELKELCNESFELGQQYKKREIALSMMEDSIPIEKIAYYIKVSPETVQKWVDESLANAK